MFGNLTALTAPRISEEQAREPPPPATPLQFPSCVPQVVRESAAVPNTITNVFEILNDFGKHGPKIEHAKAFNIIVDQDIRREDLQPPSSWLEDLTSDEGLNAVRPQACMEPLSNGRPGPDGVLYHTLVRELSHDNGEAFRVVRREPWAKDRPTIQITHTRKFWTGLADMSEYWDTSLDHYSEATNNTNNDTMDIDDSHSQGRRAQGQRPSAAKTTYIGRRISTGEMMPHRFREETVTSFVETLTRAFHCTLDNPTMHARLKVHSFLSPLPNFRSVHRIPKDEQRARGGVKEGPLLGVLCREQTTFRLPHETKGTGQNEIHDLLKESGILALLAQRRAREGKEEVHIGAGKWWTTTPRWGGGPGGEFGNSEEEPVEGDQAVARGTAPPRKRTRKANQAEVWRAMRPPPSMWERNVTYQQVGRGGESSYDDIYLISALNHHISIVHARIHDDYIDYITNQDPDFGNASQQPWYELKIQRTRWYDLFSAQDRVELLKGMWGVFNHLMRATDGEEGESPAYSASRSMRSA